MNTGIVCYIIGVIIGAFVGWLWARPKKRRNVGNLVLIDDPDDDQTYAFLEITKGNIQYIQEQQIIELKVEKRKPQN